MCFDEMVLGELVEKFWGREREREREREKGREEDKTHGLKRITILNRPTKRFGRFRYGGWVYSDRLVEVFGLGYEELGRIRLWG